MELNNIPKSGTYADGVDRHNDNYAKINLELQTIKEREENAKGYFETLSTLETKFPSPKDGWQAYIADPASSTGYFVANVVNGAWVVTTAEAPAVGVNLAEYAKTEELENLATETTVKIENLVENTDSKIAQLAGEVIKKNEGVYSDNHYINSCIKGVYVFGDASEIESVKNENLKFNIFRLESYPRISIANDSNTSIFLPLNYSSDRKASEYNIAGISSELYTSVKVFIIFDRKLIAKKNDQPGWYGSGSVNSVFWDAKDNLVREFLDNQLWMFDNSKSIRQIMLCGLVRHISIKNRAENANYSIRRIENTESVNCLVSINKWVGGVIEKSASRIVSDDYSKQMIVNIDDTVIEIQIDWSLYTGLWSSTVQEGIFSNDVYRPSIYLEKSDINSIEKQINNNIDNLLILKTQVQNLGSANTGVINDFESIINNLRSIVDSINIEEFSDLHNNLLSNYQDLSSIVGNNKSSIESEITVLKNSLSSSVSNLIQLINEKNTAISDKEITLNQISDSLKSYIETSGGGTIINFPDEETITQSGNNLSIKPKEKTDNRSMGVVPMLNPIDLSPLTIYELNNNISHDGLINIPSGSKISPKNGLLDADISGGERSTVHSSDIGMVQDDIAFAAHNGEILRKVLRNRYNIILDGHYYVQFPAHIKIRHDFQITGGGIHLIGQYYFEPFENSSFIARNVEFTGESRESQLMYTGNLPFNLNKIVFENCKFKRIRFYIRFADIEGLESVGINEFLIRGCISDETFQQFSIRDAVIRKSAIIENNYVHDFIGFFVRIMITNNFQFSTEKALASCPVIIQNNIFKGKPCSLNDYHCTVLIECRICIFQNNHIEDVINYNGGDVATCYDSYLSCQEVYFENNTIKNMMSFRVEGGEKPRCELFKSKGFSNPGGTNPFTIRYAVGNSWFLDADYLLSLGANIEDLEADLFSLTSTCLFDQYVFKNNHIRFTKGGLSGLSTTSNAKYYLIKDNTFDIDYIRRSFLLVHGEYDIREIVIRNNLFNLKNKQVLTILSQNNVSTLNNIIESIVIDENKGVNCSFIAQVLKANIFFVKNNQTDTTEVLDNLYPIGGAITVGQINRIDALFDFPKILSHGNFISVFYIKPTCKGRLRVRTDALPIMHYFRFIIGDALNINFLLKYKIRVEKENVFKLNYNEGILTLTDSNMIVSELNIETFPNRFLLNADDFQVLLTRREQAGVSMLQIGCIQTVPSTDLFSDIILECQMY